MFALSNTILLRRVRASKLMENTGFGTKIMKLIIGILTTTIGSQSFNGRAKMIFHGIFEMLKRCKNLRFVFQRKKPCEPSKIINKYYVITMTIY
jgi:hypothetical protein